MYLTFFIFLGINAASTSIENAMVENLEDFSRLFFHNNRESPAGLEWLYWNGNDPQKRGNLKLGVIYLTFLYFVEVYAASTSIENAMVENLGDFSCPFFFITTEKVLPVLNDFTETGTITKKGAPKTANS